MGSRALLRPALLLAVCCVAACPRAPAVAPPRPIPGVWHRGVAGESAGELARRYRVAAVDIEELNGRRRGEPLAGRLVFIPGAHHAAASLPPPPTTRPSLMTPATRSVAGGAVHGTFVWPVPGGRVTSGFGVRGKRPHEGIDIVAPEGTAVVASADGRVIYAGSGVRGYGNLILLQHTDGMVSVYAHNRRNLVTEKAAVRQGQVIAEVGHTGSATASHLHFELRRGEAPIDPSRYVHP
jgi:murein DD-endopeptidase MepM/ murein hydrolase activator NlpD